MNQPAGHRRPPMFVAFLAVAVTVSLGLGVVNQVGQQRINDRRFADQQDSNRAACQRSVQGRDDNRAMWLFLLNRFPTGPQVPAFRAELNKRLPSLACVDNIPVPKENS